LWSCPAGRACPEEEVNYYDEERKEEILKTYKGRASLRGIRRIYGVSMPSVLRWLKKKSQA